MKPVDLWISIFYFMAGGDHCYNSGEESGDVIYSREAGSVRKSGRSGRRGVQRHPDGVCVQRAAEGGASVQGESFARKENRIKAKINHCNRHWYLQVNHIPYQFINELDQNVIKTISS